MGEVLPEPLAVVVYKEKSTVLDDWTSQRAAELVLLVDGYRLILESEIILGIHGIVSQKFIGAPVITVRSRFRYHVDYRAGFSAKFRFVVCLVDNEFLGGVRRRIEDDVVVILVGDIGPIHEKEIVASPLPQHVDQRPGLLQGIPARAARRIDDAFAQQCQLQKLPVLQRQIHDFVVLDHVLNGNRLSLQLFRTGFDGNGFRRASHLK